MKITRLALCIAVVLLFSTSIGLAQEMSISVRIDSGPLPLLANAVIENGTAPFSVEITVTTPLLGTIRKSIKTSLGELVVALPTNLDQSVRIEVQGANGETASATRHVSLPIFQFEGFPLDESRYQGAVVLSDDVGDQVASRTDAVGAGDRFVLPAPFGFSDGSAPVVVDWPARYLVTLGAGQPLIVTVQAREEGRLPIRGVCDDYSGRALGYTHLDEQFRRMTEAGVNAIQFIKLLSMDSETGTQIHDPNPMPDCDEQLREGMRAAKAAGFHVMLRLVIFLDAPWPRADNLQDRLEPADWDAWFNAYDSFVLHYAALCQEVGADIYAFSDTLQTTYRFEARYRELIGKIRSVYSGKLTVLTGPYADRLNAIGFWDALDYVGIDGSLHTAGYVTFANADRLSLNALYEIFVNEFEQNVLPTVEAVHKPLLWGEIYYRSVERSTYSASGVPVTEFIAAHDDDRAISYEPGTDFEQQALGHSAMLHLMQSYSEYFEGSFALQWTLDDPLLQWCCSGGSFQMAFTPTEDVLRLWWASGDADSKVTTVADHLDGVEYAEFSDTGYRGFWELDSFGRSSGAFEVISQGAEVAAIDVVSFEFSNPYGNFLRLRYTMNPSQRDYSDWDGIALAVSAEATCSAKIEVAFSDWTSAFSLPQTIGPTPRILCVPFDRFEIAQDEEKPTTATSLDPSNIDGVSVWPISTSGKIKIYAIGVYRDK